MTVAESLRRLRKARGLTQVQLARLARTKQPQISRMEQPSYEQWSYSSLRRIARALDAEVSVSVRPRHG